MCNITMNFTVKVQKIDRIQFLTEKTSNITVKCTVMCYSEKPLKY